ncbi:MAG: DMT family transporter [Verrucomicrobiota bacterium]|nr:DMT family transporter [Verrucomicrobiota bacterium]
MDAARSFPFLALLLGATSIGIAPILVRLSEVGPIATAAFRMLLALPFLFIWLAASPRDSRKRSLSKRELYLILIAGACFAGDLAFWHVSLHYTTVANSTLFTNFAPFFVALGGWLLFAETVTKPVIFGMVTAFLGGVCLVAESYQLNPRHLLGDLLALVTALFYAGYLLALKRLRETVGTAAAMLGSSLVSCPLLFGIALAANEPLLPLTGRAWLVLLALGLVSHIAGQGLIAYSLPHLTAALSGIGLMWQPVVAAVLAAFILQEPLTTLKILGGIIILGGILHARFAATQPAKTE